MQGKTIETQTIWVNGELKAANNLYTYIVLDNLVDSATFWWQLSNVETTEEETIQTVLTTGNVSLTGETYVNWGESGDINNEAYNLVAAALNLVII